MGGLEAKITAEKFLDSNFDGTESKMAEDRTWERNVPHALVKQA